MLGNVGSGKTACMVKELYDNLSGRETYSNIITKKLPNNHVINEEMIVIKEQTTVKAGEPVYKLSVNQDFWKDVVKKHQSVNVILDECHTLLDSRRAMSKKNKIMNDWLALLRRVVGQNEAGYGELILITQLERRIDPIAKEMATSVRYHICHYVKTCKKCKISWQETNETPEPIWVCPRCRHNRLKKHSHWIEVFRFKNHEAFVEWKYFEKHSYHRREAIMDIETIFPLYDTMQWDYLLSDL